MDQLPICEYSASVSLLCEILHYLSKDSFFGQYSNIINALIFNLYFSDHIKEREIDLLEFVERDIASVFAKHPALQSQKPEAFDTLSDADKEVVIEQLHQTWTDPNNEVVLRMGRFKEKSPDILKVIMES